MATVIVLAFTEDEVLSAYLGITDNEWFDYWRRNDITDEVNFWIPSAPSQKDVEPGSLWLLKLKSPRDCIAGAGVFMHYSVLPGMALRSACGVHANTGCPAGCPAGGVGSQIY